MQHAGILEQGRRRQRPQLGHLELLAYAQVKCNQRHLQAVAEDGAATITGDGQPEGDRLRKGNAADGPEQGDAITELGSELPVERALVDELLGQIA